MHAARRRNAAALIGRVNVELGDVASLPYPDECFDKAFSIHSIYFWDNPVDCLRELRRVLKPGGLITITIKPKDKWTEIQRRQTDPRTLYDSADLVQMFSAADFRDVRVEVCPEPDIFAGECVLGSK